MSRDLTLRLLRKWASGKPLSKNQIEELSRDGYLEVSPDDPDSTVLTQQGIDLLNP